LFKIKIRTILALLAFIRKNSLRYMELHIERRIDMKHNALKMHGIIALAAIGRFEK
jgi:hypothetical protein